MDRSPLLSCPEEMCKNRFTKHKKSLTNRGYSALGLCEKIQKLRFIQEDTEAALDETMEIVKTKKRAKRRREAEKDSDEEKMEVEKGPSCFLQEVDKWTW
ncbi:hypothetical protein F2P81_013271 [Scophthalmus maximus]|uniref:Uncharacterized protein n=1 Tax=Scophthalmus maximus TaxID=52904 RepID=A0A6A4SNF3_SCOMX|nr:hypothetical protein F2P81_013271 [Scophthalmus maximus]